MALHKIFYEGRTPPDVHIDSLQMQDWIDEQEHRVMHGLEYKGTRITGHHYHLLNFFPIQMITDLNTGEVGTGYPRFSQADDYIYKQSEEAIKSRMYTGLITGRGFGKTYLTLNIAAKNYNWKPKSLSHISASIDEACAKSFSLLESSLNDVPYWLAQNRIKNDRTHGHLLSGTKVKIEGKEKVIGYQSEIKKIIFEDNPGKTRGSRPSFQVFEEIGAWTASAKLTDCLNQSRGSFFRGAFMTAEVWLIGTGGQMKTGGSEDAQKIFYNPAAYNVYPVQEWYGKKTMIFMPAYEKFTGFYEDNGASDIEGAKAFHEEQREKLKAVQDEYMQYIQEYPFEPKEAFITSGTKRFNQAKLQRQEFLLNTKPEFQGIIQEGRFWWTKDVHGRISGVEWGAEKGGPVKIVEHPEKGENNQVPEKLYVSGVDSVDGDLKAGSLKNMKKDSNGDVTEISKLSFWVKKRFWSSQRTSNIYVCQITWRPENIDDAYEQVLMATIYYNCQVNVEHTKIGIIKFFQQKKAIGRLFLRPGVCYSDVRKSRNTNDYGTVIDGAGKVMSYGMNAISKYVDNFSDNIYFLDLIEELIKFEDENRTKFDRVMGVMMCEIADDELLDIGVREKKKEDEWVDVGYYTDKHGNRVFGAIPNQKHKDELFPDGNDKFVYNRRLNDDGSN